MPLISIIVPVYKTRQYLDQCVESICNQSYSNLEILLVDDGCPEGSGELCDLWAEKDPRIRVIHKANGGLSSARNAGLDVMRGAYVSFVDSDDWIEPQMYEVLYHCLQKENAQIACCGIARMQEDRRVSLFNPNQEETFTWNTVEALGELPYNCRITSSVCDKLYRAEVFADIRMKDGILYEDAQIQHRCLAKARRVTYTGAPLYCYRLSQNSILRGNFSLRHIDCYRASTDRLAFYAENFPAQLPYAQMGHLETCLNLMYFSTGREDWKAHRKQLLADLRSPVEPAVRALLSKKTKLKLAAIRLGVPVFDLMMRINDLRKGS